VEVARRLAQQPRRPGLAVVDYGIRGLDLAYALQDGWDAVILVDAAPRGAAPGTLSVIEPSLEGEAGAPSALDAHGMDPVKVLRLAQALGGLPSRVLLVGCEPSPAAAPGGDDLAMELSEPVRAAVDAAVPLVERLADTLGRREAA
jgi:hydrogenase maturation protease